MPTLSASLSLIVNISSFLVFLGVLIWTVVHPAHMRQAFWYSSYYIILTLAAAWVFVLIDLWHREKVNVPGFIKTNWKGLLCSLVLASVVFISVPKYFRVLSDETNLLSVAKSMTFYKHVHNVTDGRRYYEMFWPETPSSIEKRPFVFPFFTSLMHTLFGYRTANVFILNFFVFWAVLFILYRLMSSALGGRLVFAGLILVITQPMIVLSATSASYELFNFLFVLISFVSLRYFLRNLDSRSFFLLILNLTMLANIRYESVLFLVIVLAVLGIGKQLRLEFLKQSPAYAVIPFFFLPWVWQRILMLGEADSNLAGGSWVKSFRFENASQNVGVFFKYILSFNGELGYAGVISLIGLLAGFYFLVDFLVGENQNKPRGPKTLWIVSLTSIAVLFMVSLFYQGGINDHPMNGRLYILILVVLSVLPVFFLADIVKDKNRIAVPVLMFSLGCFVFYHPIAVEDRLSNTLFIIREYRFVDDFLKKNADKNTLVICGRPGQLIVDNYGAISYEAANQDVDAVLQQHQNHLFSAVYAIQSISYQTRSPLPDNVIDPRYQLEPVAESQMTGDYFFRISKVKVPVN